MFNKKQNKPQDLLIYGKHPVISALNNPNRKIKNIYVTKNLWQELSPLFPQIKANIHLVETRELNMMLPEGTNHQNIILEALPLKPIDLEDILAKTLNQQNSCLVILDQITDPHNIGAIIRSAAAFSADAVIVTEHNSPKENSTILKCAAGASETVPLIKVTNLANCMKLLKKEGYWIIGLDGNTDTELNSSILSSKIAFILGAEGTGIRRLTKDNCDYIAKINISSNIESLNVSNAAAIALYEYLKFSQN